VTRGTTPRGARCEFIFLSVSTSSPQNFEGRALGAGRGDTKSIRCGRCGAFDTTCA